MGAKMESSSPALSRRKSFGVLVLDAIGPAAKKLRLFLNDDYATYASSLLALDVVEEQLRELPLARVDRYVVDRGRAPPVDESVVLVIAGTDWMIRLDLATNALEDLVQEMEAIAEANPPRWWRRAAPRHAVAAWLRSDDENMTRMEIAVGRLASVYLQGGEIFDVPSDAAKAASASEGKDFGNGIRGVESSASAIARSGVLRHTCLAN
jgi:hypothetical protein